MIYANALSAQIAIGAMDEKLTLKRKTGTVTNGLGEVTSTTSIDTTIACHVVNESRAEEDVNDKQTVMDMREFVCRYLLCDEEDKVQYNGATYDIIRIETMGRKRYMKLMCKLCR